MALPKTAGQRPEMSEYVEKLHTKTTAFGHGRCIHCHAPCIFHSRFSFQNKQEGCAYDSTARAESP
jgi:hypothetical protein